MLIRNTSVNFGLKVLFVMAILAGSLQAQVEPDRSGLGQAEFKLSELTIKNDFRLPNELPDQAAPEALAALAALGLSARSGRIDVRSGRWATLMLAEPLLPGRGKGNNLIWANLGRSAPSNDSEFANAASQAFRDFIQAASDEVRVDSAEMANPGKVTVHGNGNSIQIYVPRIYNGVAVRGSYLTATINNGNMTLFGANSWGDIKTSVVPGITESDALEAVQSHAGSYTINGSWRRSELQLIPVARGRNPNSVPVGSGYDYRLAWVIRPAFDGEMRNFEALVDAHNGELLSFEDTNQYAATQRNVKGGVFPVSNDLVAPDGVEQAGLPMPYETVTTPGGPVVTDGGGNLPAPVDGNITSHLSGQYVNITDDCGAVSLTSAGDIDFGTSGGTDCVTPGFGGAGNTHASRTGFHELNRIIEMGRGQLPDNNWLQQQLTSRMNINLTCNAFWGGGQVNFYRSGGGCFNTGELAGVFDHEWGHGLDDNDAVPFIASPSGEGIADIYAALRLNTSCIGRHFRTSVCTGFGDPCLTCTGVRDIDYLQRASGQPHDYTWSNANCGGSVHCVGSVYAEAVWSLWKRELQNAPYNLDNNTAQEIVTRMTYIGAGNTGTWFSGGPPFGGCSASSGYMNYLAADDDNGDITDGTPHMTAIYNAFNDQEIACSTPVVQDSGCAGTPVTAPTVIGSSLDKSVGLTWGAVTGASSYEVFRTDGVFACDFGKVKVGETVGTSFNDSGLQNGRNYSYVVIPKGSVDACFGPASSCTTVAAAAGPNVDIDPDSAVLAILTGDGDEFIDNCEDATLTFDVNNTGLGNLTNIRITGVTVVSHPATGVTTSFPTATTPDALAAGGTAAGSFDFTAGGLVFGDTLVFEVSVTADEISPVVRTQTITISNAESDIQLMASKTWNFASDLEGWSLVEGTFIHTSNAGNTGFVASSAFLDNQCDQIRSPIIKLTATSTLSLQNNYEIEANSGQWWDRANVGIFDGSSRDFVSPDGGRTYNASGPGATCATTGQPGWADVNNTWGGSSWTATALDSASRAGTPIQLDIAYGTDALVNGYGFWFDEVTLTDIEVFVADGQFDICGAPSNQPPTVTITAPADGSNVEQGTNINFTGTASDTEDGDISANLNWTSSIDGAIGSGASINTSTLSVGIHTITADATDSGDPTANPKMGSDQITVTIFVNTPPTVTITAPADGSSFVQGTNINFTGTATDTEDGNIAANIAWTSSIDGGIGNGASFSTSTLSVGVHTIDADVTDSGGLPSNDQITVTINANTPPVVTITAPADGSGFDQGVNINFTGTAIDTEDGNISASIAWTSSIDGAIGNGASINTSALSIGTHTVDADATDSGSLPGNDSITVTVNPPPPAADVHVHTIVTDTVSAAKGRKNGRATVTVYDENEVPVGAGYTVTGKFTGSINEPDVAAVTNSSGVAVFVTTGTAKKNIVINFCVTDVSGALPYDSSDNESAGFGCAPPPALTDVHVENIQTGSLSVGGGNKHATATVTVFGDNGMAQSGYTVSGTFSGDFNEVPAPLVTGADGTVTFQTTGTKKGKTAVSFCVDNMTGAMPYDPGDNASGTYACP